MFIKIILKHRNLCRIQFIAIISLPYLVKHTLLRIVIILYFFVCACRYIPKILYPKYLASLDFLLVQIKFYACFFFCFFSYISCTVCQKAGDFVKGFSSHFRMPRIPATWAERGRLMIRIVLIMRRFLMMSVALLIFLNEIETAWHNQPYYYK